MLLFTIALKLFCQKFGFAIHLNIGNGTTSKNKL